MREVELEKKLVSRVKIMGGLALKFISPGNSGVPDRIILCQGQVWFAEVKSPGKTLRPLQRVWRKTLGRLGFTVFVVDSEDALEAMLNAIHTARLPEDGF